MAQQGEEAGSSSAPTSGLELAEYIRQIAANNARASLNDDKQLLLFMQSWWSKLYNRPLKDPLLLSYTLEELLYEFYDRVERLAAEEERSHKEETATEETREKDVMDWIDEEERKEAQKEAQANKLKVESEKKPPVDPTKDPANIKWMEEQIKLAKQHLGDDFGEDLEINFDEK
jgi:hypothetical protein